MRSDHRRLRKAKGLCSGSCGGVVEYVSVAYVYENGVQQRWADGQCLWIQAVAVTTSLLLIDELCRCVDLRLDNSQVAVL